VLKPPLACKAVWINHMVLLFLPCSFPLCFFLLASFRKEKVTCRERTCVHKDNVILKATFFSWQRYVLWCYFNLVMMFLQSFAKMHLYGYILWLFTMQEHLPSEIPWRRKDACWKLHVSDIYIYICFCFLLLLSNDGNHRARIDINK